MGGSKKREDHPREPQILQLVDSQFEKALKRSRKGDQAYRSGEVEKMLDISVDFENLQDDPRLSIYGRLAVAYAIVFFPEEERRIYREEFADWCSYYDIPIRAHRRRGPKQSPLRGSIYELLTAAFHDADVAEGRRRKRVSRYSRTLEQFVLKARKQPVKPSSLVEQFHQTGINATYRKILDRKKPISGLRAHLPGNRKRILRSVLIRPASAK